MGDLYCPMRPWITGGGLAVVVIVALDIVWRDLPGRPYDGVVFALIILVGPAAAWVAIQRLERRRDGQPGV